MSVMSESITVYNMSSFRNPRIRMASSDTFSLCKIILMEKLAESL